MSAIVSAPTSASTSASPPVLLIVTDVFGNTPAMASFARHFPMPCLIASPYTGEKTQYPAEALAYHAFIAEGGVGAYAEHLSDLIEDYQSSLRYAVGFSAGASALWLNSANPAMANLQQAVLFYGSRIRDHRDVQPACPTRLIFAEQEAAFEPTELVSDLRQRGHDAELVRGSKHGFMNPYSAGFCLKTQERFMKELFDLVQISAAA
ncbi:MAG: dienelactone hydrolase family protein [Burkholderiales bacterium]|nr:dienelactone hydrolase family protein [Burkholderiales bacterium]